MQKTFLAWCFLCFYRFVKPYCVKFTKVSFLYVYIVIFVVKSFYQRKNWIS